MDLLKNTIKIDLVLAPGKLLVNNGLCFNYTDTAVPSLKINWQRSNEVIWNAPCRLTDSTPVLWKCFYWIFCNVCDVLFITVIHSVVVEQPGKPPNIAPAVIDRVPG